MPNKCVYVVFEVQWGAAFYQTETASAKTTNYSS